MPEQRTPTAVRHDFTYEKKLCAALHNCVTRAVTQFVVVFLVRHSKAYSSNAILVVTHAPCDNHTTILVFMHLPTTFTRQELAMVLMRHLAVPDCPTSSRSMALKHPQLQRFGSSDRVVLISTMYRAAQKCVSASSWIHFCDRVEPRTEE